MSRLSILGEIDYERDRQDAKHGPIQNLPDGTSRQDWGVIEATAKAIYEAASRAGKVTWRDVLMEEVAEAFAASDVESLREELIQVAAVAVRWTEAIDRRLGRS